MLEDMRCPTCGFVGQPDAFPLERDGDDVPFCPKHCGPLGRLRSTMQPLTDDSEGT